MSGKIVLAVNGSGHSDRAVEAAAELAREGTTKVLVHAQCPVLVTR